MNQNKCRIRIRKAKDKDVIKISNLIKKTLNEVNSKDYPEEIIHFMCKFYSSRNIIKKLSTHMIYVVVKDNNILGTVSLKDNEISSFFIDPKFQYRGIGTKLMAYVELVAKKNGHNSICLSSSTTAYTFYKKLDYKKIENIYSKNFGKAIKMTKKI
jgi:N-acetylglutamate synthase-like GNAT family acetyltransferase